MRSSWASCGEHLQDNGQLVAKVATAKEEAGAKFRDYFDYREAISVHSLAPGLALFRGRKEEILQLALKLPEELVEQPTGTPPPAVTSFNSCERRIAAALSDFRPVGVPRTRGCCKRLVGRGR